MTVLGALSPFESPVYVAAALEWVPGCLQVVDVPCYQVVQDSDVDLYVAESVPNTAGKGLAQKLCVST